MQAPESDPANAVHGAKVMVIGLDSVDPQLLERGCAAGFLPNLAALRSEGVSGRIDTPAGMADDAVWASFSTGRTPAQHGRYHFRTVITGSYELLRFKTRNFDCPPFWEALSQAGKRVAVIDVPKSPSARQFDGIQIHDWRVHGRDGETATTPPELAKELERRFGPDRTDRVNSGEYLCDTRSADPAVRLELLDRLQQSVADKTTLAAELLASDHWDLFLTVYKEGHCAGHQFWPPDAQLLSVYRALDSAVGQLVAAAGSRAQVIVFSTLGMDINHSGEHLLDEVLRRLEARFAGRGHAALVAADRVYHGVRRRIGRPAEQPRQRARLAYQVPFNEISGAIRINLAGREANGKVEAGEAQERLTKFLETELLNLRNPADGRPAVQEVLRTRDPLAEPTAHPLPDLLAVWSRSGPIDAVESPMVGAISAPSPALRPGNHLAGGIYFATCTEPGTPGLGGDCCITELGPAIASLLGVDLE